MAFLRSVRVNSFLFGDPFASISKHDDVVQIPENKEIKASVKNFNTNLISKFESVPIRILDRSIPNSKISIERQPYWSRYKAIDRAWRFKYFRKWNINRSYYTSEWLLLVVQSFLRTLLLKLYFGYLITKDDAKYCSSIDKNLISI